MNSLRTFLAGFIISGAFGAKVGAYISSIKGAGQGWSYIELGFLIGAALGLVAAFSIYFIRNEVVSRQGMTRRSSQLLAKTA